VEELQQPKFRKGCPATIPQVKPHFDRILAAAGDSDHQQLTVMEVLPKAAAETVTQLMTQGGLVYCNYAGIHAINVAVVAAVVAVVAAVAAAAAAAVADGVRYAAAAVADVAVVADDDDAADALAVAVAVGSVGSVYYGGSFDYVAVVGNATSAIGGRTDTFEGDRAPL